MELSDSVLKQISYLKYDRMKNFWFGSRQYIKHPERLEFAEITSPLITRSYSEWWQFLIEHPKGDRISAYDGVGWRKYYIKKITSKELEEIEQFAKNRSQKAGNVEVQFLWENNHPRYTRSIVIRLVQLREGVIGHEIRLNTKKAGLLTWECPATFTKSKVCGLWLPPQVA